MDDHDFKSVRKAFNIIGVLILILAYSNAEINGINFLGIDITLQGKKVYVGIFIFYLYFTWRYLTKLPYRSKFLNDFHQFFLGSHGVKKDYIKEEIYEVFKQEETDYFVGLNITRDNPRPLRKLNFEWSFQKEETHSRYEEKEKIELNRLYVAKKFLWFCFKYDKFGDYIFPFIPLLINVLFFFLDKDWQGSLYNII